MLFLGFQYNTISYYQKQNTSQIQSKLDYPPCLLLPSVFRLVVYVAAERPSQAIIEVDLIIREVKTEVLYLAFGTRH